MPEAHYADLVAERDHAYIHRLEDTVRRQADDLTQMRLTVARLADENRDARNRLARFRAGGQG